MTLKEMLDKMGIPYVMGPYETNLWTHTDGDSCVTASADVAMSPYAEELESQILFFYDKPPEGKNPTDQVFKAKAVPKSKGNWSFDVLDIKGECHKDKVPDWEKNTCDFFRACCQALQRGEIPDIDELLDEEFFKSKGRFGGRRGGRGGGRSVNMKSVGTPPRAPTGGMK